MQKKEEYGQMRHQIVKERERKKEKNYRIRLTTKNMAAAIALLENITQNHYKEVNRDIKGKISELVSLLKDRDPNFSLSVRGSKRCEYIRQAYSRQGHEITY